MNRTLWARVQNWIPFIAALLMFVHAFVLRYTPDDAFVSFRYALNIARGYGPVFNLGQHVEGYTSPSWVFTLGTLKSIGLPIEPLALVLSISAGVLAVLVLPLLSRRLGYEVSGVDALLLAANTSFAVWAGASMEMTVFAFVLVLATLVFVLEQRPWLAGLLFAVLALVRPEGLLFGLLAVLFSFWRVTPRRERNAWRNWLVFSAMFAVPVLAHLMWRLAYYGYPLPNTFYDKVGFSIAQLRRGIEYLAGASWQYLVPLSIPLLIGLTTVRDRKRCFVAVAMLSYLAYVASVGGDWMVSFRLFTLVMPLIALFAASGWLQIWQWTERSLPKSYSIVPVLGVVLILVLDIVPSLRVETRQAYRDDGEVIAGWVNNHCPANLRLAVYAAGSASYYAPDFQIVDMFGLTKEDIAHMQVATIGEGEWAGHEKFSAPLTMKEDPNIFIFNAALDDAPITTADGWQATSLAHLTRQFTDDIDFWTNHSTQTAPMPNGKYFNFVVLNPDPCK